MITTLYTILNLLALIVFFIVFILLTIWMVSGYKAKVPFVPVPNKILEYIKKALDVKEGSVVYDLGCGEGRVLFYLSKFTPKAKYIGIENSPFPLILVRVRAWWHHLTNKESILIINDDFFNHDLSNATHIFTYLYPNVMDDILPKLDKELKKGTKLVSFVFKFTTKQPIKEIEIKNDRRKLYVYEF